MNDIDPRDGTNWHLGLKAGSYPGFTISVVTAALAILTAAVINADNY
ncbi:hypothetical protein ACFLQW_03695 [Candidatus Zixiibacteriota bacterium]